MNDADRILRRSINLIIEHRSIIKNIVNKPYYDVVRPMMKKIYEKMRIDVKDRNYNSPVFKHHLNHPILGNCYRNSSNRRIIANEDDIVVDYIASMTDDYFLDLFVQEFPNDNLCKKIKYVSYFE